MTPEPVTVVGPGAVVVFHEYAPGAWVATAYPGPSGFGDTPGEALAALLKSWPDALQSAASKRGRS